MSADDLMQDAIDAQRAWENADQGARDAAAVRSEAIARALDAGCGATLLARTLGVTRARVYQLAAQRG